ncbi:SPFH domain-containing protein [Streptomyces sp. NPDC001380]|uniref:SPFH domain-containing protein n=1 Tax=Streptomyces sp. NPDC001380 TaxID=3364566 RepID=UPI0036CA40F0
MGVPRGRPVARSGAFSGRGAPGAPRTQQCAPRWAGPPEWGVRCGPGTVLICSARGTRSDTQEAGVRRGRGGRPDRGDQRAVGAVRRVRPHRRRRGRGGPQRRHVRRPQHPADHPAGLGADLDGPLLDQPQVPEPAAVLHHHRTGRRGRPAGRRRGPHPSSDGVDMGIEGTLYFTLNLDQKTLRDFDNKFGTRGFTGADGRLYHAYDGDLGWSAFLDQIIRPVIDNDLREQISRFRCAELVSSCALVQNSGSPGVPPAGAGKTNNGNIAAVQNAVNSSLAEDLKVTLGDEFLQGLRFNLVRVSLPDNVQAAVDKAQAAFAAVSEAQARVAQAKADAAANSARQQGYQKCPACAVIDEMKAIPPSVTTFAPGQNFAVTAPGK